MSEKYKPEITPEGYDSHYNPSVGSMDYLDTFFDLEEEREARKRRQEEITRRMSEMVIAEYHKHIKERKDQWWFGFNQDLDYD